MAARRLHAVGYVVSLRSDTDRPPPEAPAKAGELKPIDLTCQCTAQVFDPRLTHVR